MTARGAVQLTQDLARRFAAGVHAAWPEREFDDLALEAFALQYESIPSFRGFCDARERTPTTVSSWRDVPAVPATAFKHVDLCVGEPEAVFLTSGTTRGSERRGRHLVPSLDLYRASLLPPFEAHVLAGADRMAFLSLIPSPRELPDSSLSFMVGATGRLSAGIAWLADAERGIDTAEVGSAFEAAAARGHPVLVLGTALALLHALEWLGGKSLPPLPEGSRILETGGFKGAERSVGKDELYARLSEVTGVPHGRIVNEYGMTELLSQLYTPVLTEGPEAASAHVAPPWLKVRVLDPVTLDELPDGEAGLLCFFDLANAGSVCHVLTEDVGTVEAGRVRLLGRAEGAEPRGCSRAMDELVAAAGRAER